MTMWQGRGGEQRADPADENPSDAAHPPGNQASVRRPVYFTESTLSQETSPDSLPSFPAELRERYEHAELIGEGGMGAVYKARDTRLGRHVAIKFIRRNTPEHTQRLFWEAQAQARVEHPNVCKVYEVGEVRGQPFIVMQYIAGEPLHHMATKLTIEQRVRVIRDVAEGLHAAHRLGLIHRDIKPANILVERTNEGEIRPYVADFGLARDVSAGGSTVYNLEGTPAYMSPEQIGGSVRNLDRRTDVYSLGAATYEILVGWPPFPESSLPDMIWKIANDAPTPPRKLVKEIPRDLDSIVMICLEKEAQHRYDSAKALADDLGRYLEGEPIRASTPSLLYRALRHGRKHKIAVSVSAVGFLCAIFVSVVAIRARLEAVEQAEVARHVGAVAQGLGQDVKEIELFLRYTYAMPIHDTMREKAIVRAQMQKVQRQTEEMRPSLGKLIEGPGNYALGRGYLALGELEEARNYLEQAWSDGYNGSDASFALGLAHGMLYRESIFRSYRFADAEVSEEYQRQIEKQHLEPALMYLRRSASADANHSPYAAALIALYERRLDVALSQAQLALEQSPWAYEAMVLQGDVYSARAALARDRGDHTRALEDYMEAVGSYEAASTLARSDPAVYDAVAETWFEIMRLSSLSNTDTHAAFRKVIESCDNALLVEPQRDTAYTTKAWAYIHEARQLLSEGADPRPMLAEATRAGEQAVRWNPDDATAHNAIGASHFMIAAYESELGADTRLACRTAIYHMEKAIALDPNLIWAWSDIGIAYGLMAEYEASRGGSPLELFERSITSIQQAVDMNPFAIEYRVNLGWFSAKMAQYELDRGLNPEDALTLATDTLEASLFIRNDSYQSYNNIGLTYLIEGRYLRMTGGDASLPLSRAIESYQTVLRINPGDIEAREGAALAHVELALLFAGRDADPNPALKDGTALAREILAKWPENAAAYQILGQLHLVGARYALRRGQRVDDRFNDAERALGAAIERSGNDAQVHGWMALLHAARGEAASGKSPRAKEHIRVGRAMVARALALNPDLPWLFAVRGTLDLAEAKSATSIEARGELAQSAVSSFEMALQRNPFLQKDHGAELAEAKAMLDAITAAGAHDAAPRSRN